MAIGRISGSVLKSNLTRNGTDLAFETNLLYLDVTNSRVGIGTSEPTTALQVNGTVTTSSITTAGGTTTGNFTFNDSVELRLGTDADANIKHTGSDLNINETTGDIHIRTYANDKDVKITSDDGSGGTATYFLADGSTGAVKLYHYGTNVFETTSTGVAITNTSTSDALLITTTEDSSSAGPVIALKRNSSSPADADYLGQIKFQGENDADQEIVYAKITGKIQDASDGTEDGIIEFANKKAGSNVITARLRSDSLQLLNSTSLTVAGDATVTGSLIADGISYPTADGSNGQVLTTDGSGNLSFSESSGGGGGNNTAVKQFNYYKLDTTTAVIDEFDITEYRGAIYDVIMEDQENGFVGHLKVSVVHDDSTPYVSTYNVNEDSTRIADFTVAISGDMVQLSAATNTSSHTNLRIYRIALGDHHETVANTNSKIIKSSTNISSSATTLDQFTTTDIRGAKYVVLIKDDTAGDYQISEVSITHDGTTAYHDDYALVSSRGTPLHTISASITSSTLSLLAASSGNTTGTAILYRQDLGSSTKLGEFDNFFYGVKGDIDSAVETVDTFDVFKYKTARYFIAMESGSEYQNSEVTMTVNNAGTDATISESFVITANNTLATFSADVSGGKARLRASCNPNTKIYFARLSMEADNIYRASGQTSDNLYITHNNITSNDTQLILSGMTGALTLPKGTTGQRPTGVSGMLRYNTTTDTYERYDSSTSSFIDIATQASVSESSDTSTGEQTSIGTTATNIDTFTTGTFDSAFYLGVMKDEINDELATVQLSLVHNDSDAFVSAGGGVQQGTNDQLTFTADINSGTVRLKGTGTAAVNSIKFFKIGLGDNTSATSSGNTATIINTDVDSAVENLDTWAHGTYRGAKYYISANNTGKTELHNIECLVVHNGTDAFITTYNSNFTGNNELISLTADISGSSVRLRASGNEPNTAVKMYRVLLGDAESDASSTNTKTVGQTTTSSSATTMDTFSTDSANGVHYVVVGNSSSESAASIAEVFVVSDGSDAYVSSGPIVSTKGSDQLSFSASLSGSTVTVSSASTSGASTTVNAYRVNLLRASAGAATSEQVLVSTTQTISGAKTLSNAVVKMTNLPTSDPGVAGQLWNDSGTLKISAG